jgi:hypothetical protein
LTLYPELRQQYLSVSEADDVIRKVFYTQLDDAPLRLLDTTSGLLCDREAQICGFKLSTEYKGLSSLIVKHADIRTERIKEVVTLYFRCVMLSHMWQGKEPLLHDIKDKVVYELNPVDGIVKLQSFCKTARDTGYRWAWTDTCCIDQSNKQSSKNHSISRLFGIATRHLRSSTLLMFQLFRSLVHWQGALGTWIFPEVLTPKVVLFLPKRLDAKSRLPLSQSLGVFHNHGGVGEYDGCRCALPGHLPSGDGMRPRKTSMGVDACHNSAGRYCILLFGIFGIHLPIIYGEKKQNALRRLLQEFLAQSGDITRKSVLDLNVIVKWILEGS